LNFDLKLQKRRASFIKLQKIVYTLNGSRFLGHMLQRVNAYYYIASPEHENQGNDDFGFINIYSLFKM